MNSDYQLICLDLDGTLFNSAGKISDRNLAVLRSLHAAGVHVALSTGRAAYDARRIATRISPELFFIAANGSVVGHTSDPNYLSVEAIPPASIHSLIALCDEIGASPELFTPEYTLIRSYRIFLWHIYSFIRRGFKNARHTQFRPLQTDFERVALDRMNPVTKAFLFFHDRNRLEGAGDAIARHPEFEVTPYLDSFYEVTRAGVNKSTGIQVLMHHLGIKREQVIAFGDSGNDVDMLKFAGAGVAMGNSSTAIQEVADRVTETNNEDGVARELERVFGL